MTDIASSTVTTTVNIEPAPTQQPTISTQHLDFVNHADGMLAYLTSEVARHNELLALVDKVHNQVASLHDNLKKEVVQVETLVKQDVQHGKETFATVYSSKKVQQEILFVKKLINLIPFLNKH